MARIAGVNIPDDKRSVISLTYIYGIGKSTSQDILDDLKINPDTRIKDLTEKELGQIRERIGEITVEGELRQQERQNIKRLKDIDSYRGDRHKKNLPVRGQRTRTNARTKRGKRATVGGTKTKAAPKT